MKRKILIVALLFSFWLNAIAQQDAMYSQYMFNQLLVNPAYAGNQDALNITAIRRWQWVNMDGAPRTLTFAADAPVWNDRVGLGLTVLSDRIGVTMNNSIFTTYSYRIKTSEESSLSFGLQLGVSNFRSELSSLTTTVDNDPTLAQNTNRWLPNVGSGVYYKTKRFYAGFSLPHLIKTRVADGMQSFQRRHYFITAGYSFNASKSIALKPSLLLKYVRGSTLQVDINLNTWFYDRIGVGVSYRTGDSVVVLAEFMITPQLGFGYAYDAMLTPLKMYTSGSHELLLRYRVKKG